MSEQTRDEGDKLAWQSLSKLEKSSALAAYRDYEYLRDEEYVQEAKDLLEGASEVHTRRLDN